MKSAMSHARERALRKELLQARAAVERQSLRRATCALVHGFSPAALLGSMVPKSLSGKSVGSALVQGARFLSRYPFLLSSLSGLFSGRGRSKARLLKAGVGAVTVWQVIRLFNSRS